mgnify:CR=1 FL=1
MRLFYFIIALSISLISCGDEELSQEVIDSNNDIEITNYLTANNLTATKTASGMYVRVVEEGSAEKPTINDEVTVNYSGYLIDDSIFDSSTSPIKFPLSGVIRGWQEGIPYFGRGGSGSLYIPSRLAYGNSSPSSSIPANSVLIFDIELIDF